MEVKDNRNRAMTQIERLSASKVVLDNYDSNTYAKVPCKKKARNVVLPA